MRPLRACGSFRCSTFTDGISADAKRRASQLLRDGLDRCLEQIGFQVSVKTDGPGIRASTTSRSAAAQRKRVPG